MPVPLVLAGPILRRCDATEATVWLALREPKRVTLRVYPVIGTTVGDSAVLTGSADTRQFGAQLHVVTVRATSAAPVAWGQLYAYQLFFGPHASAGEVPDTGNAMTLAAPEVLGDAVSCIAYVPFEQPTYALPPQDVGGLRVVHGSCRKVHGEGTDALPVVNELIRESAREPLKRPHLLLMTGDQIYADDVSDSLLHHILSLLDPFSWVEDLAYVATGRVDLWAGHRGRIAEELAGLSAGKDISKSHLMRFGEFMLMYLMAWSPVLWPDTLPTFEQVFPELDAEFRKLTKRSSGDWWDGPWNDESSRVQRLVARKHAFETERTATNAFRRTLPDVRRLLANVPTLMMMDDHEVTDDWYLSCAWCVKVLSEPLGRRIIQNGLAAFAVCQAWGNTPARFEGSERGADLLSLISGWATKRDDPPRDLAMLLGVPEPGHVMQERTVHVQGMRWHYHLDGPEFQILVLDSRTARAFPSGPEVQDDDPPFLLGTPALDEQIKNAPARQDAKLLIVVSPAPVYGDPLVEWIQEFNLRMGILRNPEFFDAESWGLRYGQIETLQARLANRCQRILILSGDVHYGFSARTDIRASRDAVIAQLTSSPFRNEDKKTRVLHRVGYGLGDSLPAPVEWLVWLGPEPITVRERVVDKEFSYRARRGPTARRRVDGSRTVIGASRKPDLRSRTEYLLAGTPTNAQLSNRVDSIPEGLRVRLEALRSHATNYAEYAGRHGIGKEVVGVNNVGVITFDWPVASTAPVVRHQLWWRLEQKNAAGELSETDSLPLTRFEIPLGFRDEWASVTTP